MGNFKDSRCTDHDNPEVAYSTAKPNVETDELGSIMGRARDAIDNDRWV